MKKLLIKYWKEITIWIVFISMLVTIIVLFNRPQVTVTIEDTKKIEMLRDSVNVLNKSGASFSISDHEVLVGTSILTLEGVIPLFVNSSVNSLIN